MQSPEPQNIFRDGHLLVVRQRWVELPAGCVVCGEAERARMPLKIRKASRLCAIFGLIGMLFYFTVPVARIKAGLCDRHLGRERNGRLLIRGLLIAVFSSPLIAFWVADPESKGVWLAMAFVVLNFTALYEIVRSKPLKAVHADRYFVWLDRVSPVILNQVSEADQPAENAASAERP